MAVSKTPWQHKFENVEQRSIYLLTSGLWSDCTFEVGSDSETNQAKVPASEHVPAHKLVLAMASPVFEAMFYGGLSKDKPIVSIPDIPSEAFKALLRYIYTGNIKIDSFSMACHLWYGAHKYMLPCLVKKCDAYICSVLDPGNACQAYELARLFDEKTLMDKCIKLICTKTKEVLNDSSFEGVQLNTVITVCSLDNLNVDSELDLFHAVARYAEAEQRRQELMASPANGAPPSEELSDNDKVLLPRVESSETSPVDSKPSIEVTPSEPTTDKEDLKDKPSIRTAIKSLRFLTLSAAQFSECPPRSDLLTKDESLAIFMNIASTDSPIPMPPGFSECRERRHPRSDWIDKGLLTKLLPKLSTESGSIAATQLPTPSEVVRDLTSSNEETLERAVRAARYMTCADAKGTPGNLSSLVAAGGMPPLLNALHCPRTGVQYDAAWAIANIASDGNSDNISNLYKCGGIRQLVGVLKNGGAVAEQAAWALGNIASLGYKEYLVEFGAVPALLARMLPTIASAPLGTYVRTYRILCQQHELEGGPSCSRYETLSRAVPRVDALLELDDEQVLVEACGVLDHLASHAKFNEEVFTPALCTRLIALLQPAAAPRVQTAALSAVGSMLRTTVLRGRCQEAGCLDHIAYFLKFGNQTQVEKAAQATTYIMLSTPNDIQLALNKGILEALVPALTDGIDECKVQAALVITYLCARGSAPQLRMLTDSTALQPYCWLLTAGGCLCGDVLRSLTQLLQKVDHNTKPDLLLKLREIGVPQLLDHLQQDKDEGICKLANDLLQTSFNNDQ